MTIELGVYSNATTRQTWLGWIKVGRQFLFLGGVKRWFKPCLVGTVR